MVSCSFLNVLDDGHGLCREVLVNQAESLKADADFELEKGSPRGYASKPYSRESWDGFWNHMVFYNWDLGPDSCGGTYVGQAGPKIIEEVVLYRKSLGLPAINWEERNADKGL